MKLQKVFCITLLFLSGCMSFDIFEQAWPELKGKNIQVAIDHLGIPSGQYVVAGKNVYVWSTSESFTSLTASPSNTVGTVGNASFSASSMSYMPTTSQLSCVVKISTDSGIIERMEYDGSNGTCFKYSERLKPLLSDGSEKKK